MIHCRGYYLAYRRLYSDCKFLNVPGSYGSREGACQLSIAYLLIALMTSMSDALMTNGIKSINVGTFLGVLGE